MPRITGAPQQDATKSAHFRYFSTTTMPITTSEIEEHATEAYEWLDTQKKGYIYKGSTEIWRV